MKLTCQVEDLPLKHTFTIAHQSRDVQDTLIVKLKDGAFFGLGESTTNPFYGMTIAHIAPLLDYVDMDGAMLLAKDPAKGVVITPEEVIFPEGNGIGAEMVV